MRVSDAHVQCCRGGGGARRMAVQSLAPATFIGTMVLPRHKASSESAGAKGHWRMVATRPDRDSCSLRCTETVQLPDTESGSVGILEAPSSEFLQPSIVLYLSFQISHHRGCSCLHEGSIIFLVRDPSYLTFHKEMAKLHRNDLGLD